MDGLLLNGKLVASSAYWYTLGCIWILSSRKGDVNSQSHHHHLARFNAVLLSIGIFGIVIDFERSRDVLMK